jgi:hypothetical protein
MGPSTAARRAWLRVHVLFALSFGTGACFNPPAADVMFTCDLEAAPACPDGYTCQDDGCCHRDGSDVEANRGACRIGGGPDPTAADTGATAATAPTTAATDADATTSAATTGAATDDGPSSSTGGTAGTT